jgi:WXG100 family type VII secretion target
VVVGGYAVDPAELERAAAVLDAAVAESRAALEPLRAAAAGLLAARWQGGAATAFRLGWEHWLDGVLAMLAALDQLALALRSSGHGYAATEEAVRTSLGTVAS